MMEYSTYYETRLYPTQNEVLKTLKSLNLPFYLTGGTALSRGYFSLLMPKESDMDKNAIKALREMQLISALNGNSEMSLDEINAEITASRQGL